MSESIQLAEERISLPEIADELNCHKQTLFKIAKRLGIVPIKQRDSDRRNQLVATVTSAEALILRRELLISVRPTGDESGTIESIIADEGVFYLVQLEPTHDPGRIKLGFTTDIEGRLRHHRCSAPFVKCLKSWPCRRTWERAAMDCAAAGLEQLHTEIFRCDSIEEIFNRADRFFSIMPAIKEGTGESDDAL